MPLGRPGEPDRYLPRVVLGVVLAVVLFVLIGLFGPSPQTIDEWFAHTGTEGEIQILDRIDIIEDDDDVTVDEPESMAGATQGVPVDEERPTPVERAEEKVPIQNREEVGRSPRPTTTNQFVDEQDFADVERQMVEQHTRSQHAMGFPPVIEAATPLRYLDPRILSRRYVVRAQWWVDASGSVDASGILIAENTGPTALAEAVIAAVSQWRYDMTQGQQGRDGFWDQYLFEFLPVVPRGGG